MHELASFEPMKQALIAVLMSHGGEVEVDFADLGEAALTTAVRVVIDRTAKGAVVKVVESSLASYQREAPGV